MNDDNAGHYFEHSDQFHMALDLTAGRRGLAGAWHSDRALGRASAGGRRRGRAADRDARRPFQPGTSASTPTARGSATRCGTAKNWTSAHAGRVVGLFRLTFRDPERGRGQGEGRAGLPDPGDGPGQGAAHEAAESRHRSADPASGGGDMSAPQATIAVGVIVERVKAQSQWIDFLWRPTAVLPGSPTPRPGASSPTRASARRSMPALPRSDLHRTDTAHYRTNLDVGRAGALGGVAADRRRAALRAHSRDRRSVRGRSHDRGRQQHRRAGADAGCDPRRGCGVRRRAPCRAGSSSSASATAPIPKRWAAARRPCVEDDE